MALEYLKSGAITNLDASPMVVNSAGSGGMTRLHVLDGSVTATTAGTIGSTYQLVRVRSNAIVKHLYIKLNATVTEFDADIGYYYSTAIADGTQPGNQNAVAPAVKVGTGQEFGAAVILDADVTFVDHCNGVTAANLDKEAWAVAGLATDPGGFFDICLTLTDTTIGAPVVYAEAQIATG